MHHTINIMLSHQQPMMMKYSRWFSKLVLAMLLLQVYSKALAGIISRSVNKFKTYSYSFCAEIPMCFPNQHSNKVNIQYGIACYILYDTSYNCSTAQLQ